MPLVRRSKALQHGAGRSHRHLGGAWRAPGAFDEIWGMAGPTAPRAEFAALVPLAGGTPIAPSCSAASKPPKRPSASLGITFAVYGEERRGGADHPLRHRAAHLHSPANGRRLSRGAGPARRRRSTPSWTISMASGGSSRESIVPPELILRQRAVPRPRSTASRTAARHLGPYLRHRPGAHRPRPTSSCSRTMPARPRASPTCSRIARR